jgi:hypothetical protein
MALNKLIRPIAYCKRCKRDKTIYLIKRITVSGKSQASTTDNFVPKLAPATGSACISHIIAHITQRVMGDEGG